MKLRVGLVGLGDAWESRHCPALRELADRYDVRVIFEQVRHRAQQVAKEFKASTVDGYRALTMREDIDAVLMLSPQWFGPLPIMAACDAGKAVYCAVALDLDLEEAARLREYVEESGVAFMAEFPKRLAPATLRLKELIATRLGQPRLLFCHHRQPVAGSLKPDEEKILRLRSKRNLIEMVDWCQYVVGNQATSVIGTRHDSQSEIDENGKLRADYEMMSLDFSSPERPGSGPVAQISSGQYVLKDWPEAVNFRPPAELQVSCDHGVAFIDLPDTLVWFDKAGQHRESLESDRPVGEQLLAQFHRSVTSLVLKSTCLNDAHQALSTVLSARRSHAEGRRVQLTPPPAADEA